MDEDRDRGGEDVLDDVAGPVGEVGDGGDAQRQIGVDRHAEDSQRVVEHQAAGESAEEQGRPELQPSEAAHGPAGDESRGHGVEGEREDVTGARSGEHADAAVHTGEDRQSEQTEEHVEQGRPGAPPRPEHHSAQGDREGLESDRHTRGADGDRWHHREGCEHGGEDRDEGDIAGATGGAGTGETRRGGAVCLSHEYSIVRDPSGPIPDAPEATPGTPPL